MNTIPGAVPINIENGKNSSGIYSWDSPLPIQKQIPDVMKLPLNAIPEAFHTWIVDVSERMSITPDAGASAAIVMTGSVIGTACGVRPKKHDDWLVIPNLWGAIIAPPSALKTPAMHAAFKPLRKLEVLAKHEYDLAVKEYQHAKENSNTEVDKPTWKRYRTNDSTIEKCAELLAVNHRGILVERDELTGMLSTWDKTGRESDRAFYLEAWNGYGSHTTDRINRGTVHVDKLCLSIFGGIQPERLANYFYTANKNQNDGLLQRFQLAVYPDQNESWSIVDREPNKASEDRIFEIIKTLSSTNIADLGAIENEYGDTPYFQFDSEAQALFYEWWEELQNRLKNKNDSTIFIEHLAKYRSLVPSLALIFHLIDVVSGNTEGSISKLSLSRALAYTEYLESHARRIYEINANQSLSSVEALAGKLLDGKLIDQFSVRDVYRKQWHSLTDRSEVQEALDELEDMNWVRSSRIEGAFRQREKTLYFINPKIETM